MNNRRFLIPVILAGASGHALASGVTAANLDEVVVTAGRIVLAGAPRAASEGTVFHEQLENRPLLRTAIIPRMQLALALWQLEVDSELLFIGDGGATEASRPSRRRGVELGLYARPTGWMIVDADLAWSEPRFRDDDPAGDRIPGAVERVASLGVTFDLDGGWFGGARLRYLGPSALVEDNSVRAPGSTRVNLEAGRRLSERLKLTLGIYNAFDEGASDIRYFYESQLPGEPEPVADIHFHPVEPRTARLTVDFAL